MILGRIAIVFFLLLAGQIAVGQNVRRSYLLNDGWRTIANDSTKTVFRGFESLSYNDRSWQLVDVPHNWDDYGGYRRLVHGNRHGYAAYRKTFKVEKQQNGKRYFLFFEGVGSYATVWLNGDSVGYHAGGRTSFTLDVTNAIRPGKENVLAVRADHPANIRDLPWVCGGCSPEWGFSEGSQPMGIFRPVHLVVTDEVRVEPFGVHIWNDDNISDKQATLNLTTEVKNYGGSAAKIHLVNVLKDASGKVVRKIEAGFDLPAGRCDTVYQVFENIENPHLWSLDDPCLYVVHTEIYRDGKLVDTENTSYGIRWIKWDISGANATNRFYLNGTPVFINGTAEYEHLMGQGHAFSDEQVRARVAQVRAAGYNAFRDAHQPHNSRYKEEIDRLGLLWWPQMGAHIWFDTPEFRKNFKQLLTDWIRERRNSPSVVLWGLENESTLPTDFAKECTDLIRKLDPTASKQRLVTTCNGGTGTDWNVVQNWSGTYGGNPDLYDQEISKQLLNGEYGAWRSIDAHSEGGFVQNGPYTEDRFSLLMESKVRLAEAAREHCCGQFHWLLASHDNPGRTQGGEGMRELDRLGPVNYKGAITIWGEPLDVYYMFRANYAPKETEPMVYIVSHTWPDRWTTTGKKDGIRVFSNCDEVELFNGVREHSFGRKTNPGKGQHFVWDQADIQNNVLYAVGYVAGKEVAHDYILLNHLPKADRLDELGGNIVPLTETKNRNYLYRVNCGGPDYTDSEGNVWMADVHKTGENTWGSHSWTDDYPGLPAFYGSQRQTSDPIVGTRDWPLFQTFRYGMHKLWYEFPVPDGNYQVELFFIEPWYGTGGGMDCTGWRLFDVAVNDRVVIADLDIWKEAGHDRLLKKTLQVNVKGGILKISFPKIKAGQAVISAIAISSDKKNRKPAVASSRVVQHFRSEVNASPETWMNTGDRCFTDSDIELLKLPAELYGAEWIRLPHQITLSSGKIPVSFTLNTDADVFVGLADSLQQPATFSKSSKAISTDETGEKAYSIYQKRFGKGETVEFALSGSAASAIVAIVPVTQINDVIDLRPTVTLSIDGATTYGASQMTKFYGKDCVLVPGNGDAVEWQFSVGLASKYGLEFRYLNTDGRALKAEMSITSIDGREMWRGPVCLDQPGEKWKSFRTDTQTTINAGIYKLKLTLLEPGPAYFNSLKIQ
jgi:hypothetical protein